MKPTAILVLLLLAVPTAARAAEGCDEDAAWAASLEGEGKALEAASRLRAAARACPDRFPDAEARARQLEDQAFAQPPPPPPIPEPPPRAILTGKRELSPEEWVEQGEEPTTAGRVELIVGQTLHGTVLAGIFCAGARICNSAETTLLSLTFGSVAGMGGSMLASSGGIRPGVAGAINAGTLWGLGDGLVLGGAFFSGSGSDVALAAGAGGLLGTATGALIGYLVQPTAGQVAMANSGAIWTVALSAWTVFSLYRGTTPQIPLLAMGLAGNVGLVGMAMISRYYPVSRGRMFVIDLGGVLGMLAGISVSALAGASNEVRLGLVLAGTVGGLCGATLLSRPLDATRAPPVEVSLSPGGPKGTPGFSATVVF